MIVRGGPSVSGHVVPMRERQPACTNEMAPKRDRPLRAKDEPDAEDAVFALPASPPSEPPKAPPPPPTGQPVQASQVAPANPKTGLGSYIKDTTPAAPDTEPGSVPAEVAPELDVTTEPKAQVDAADAADAVDPSGADPVEALQRMMRAVAKPQPELGTSALMALAIPDFRLLDAGSFEALAPLDERDPADALAEVDALLPTPDRAQPRATERVVAVEPGRPIAEQVADAVQKLAQDANGDGVIRILGGDAGNFNAHVQHDGQSVSLRLVAEGQAQRLLLSERLPELRDALVRAGFRPDVDVSTSDRGGRRPTSSARPPRGPRDDGDDVFELNL